MTTLDAARTVMECCDLLAALPSRPDGIEQVYLSDEHGAADTLVGLPRP
jgi:hypothetical protein